MISIISTPKLNGITIQGDFDDLNTLYNAISDFTDLCVDMTLNELQSEYLKKHCTVIENMRAAQMDKFFHRNRRRISYLEELRENLLGLCYDIRHACQGERGVEFTDNHRWVVRNYDDVLPETNLQFSAEVLYPWAFYYLFALRDMLDNMYKQEWLDSAGEYTTPSKKLDIQLHRSVIEMFIALMWKEFETLLGKEFDVLYNYFIHKDCSALPDRAYLMGMCNYLAANKHREGLSSLMYRNFKKRVLIILAYDSMDADNIHDKAYSKEPYVAASKMQYRKAIEYVNKVAQRPYITHDAFLSEPLKAALEEDDEDSEALTELFGEADWDNFEW